MSKQFGIVEISMGVKQFSGKHAGLSARRWVLNPPPEQIEIWKFAVVALVVNASIEWVHLQYSVRWEDLMAREGTDQLPWYAEAKKTTSSTSCVWLRLRTSFRDCYT